MSAQTIYPSQSVVEVAVGAVRQIYPVHLNHIADKGNPFRIVLHILFVIVQLDGQPVTQERPRKEVCAVDILHQWHHHYEIVHKSLVPAAPGSAPLRHCLVKWRKVEVRQYLGREVPDRQPPVLIRIKQAFVVRKKVE